eukprot:scaffold330299_cov75-Tisochrysis_lutea.AAC.1
MRIVSVSLQLLTNCSALTISSPALHISEGIACAIFRRQAHNMSSIFSCAPNATIPIAALGPGSVLCSTEFK